MDKGPEAQLLKAAAMQIPPAEKIVITVITDNLADATRRDERIAKRPVRRTSNLDAAMHAEHGLAYHIETVVDGRSHSCLFDFGADARGVLRNIELLQIDFQKIDAIALSHDHWDHQSALIDILKAKREEIRKVIPFYVGVGCFAGTYSRRPDGSIISATELRRNDVEQLGLVRIVEVTEPAQIIPGACLPGRIDQVTDYEKVAPTFLAREGNDYVQETFVGEQAVILHAKGRGLVVISGCAHRGIVNTVRQAQKITGIEKVCAVVGGFHLTGAKAELIQRTIADIKAIAPEYVVPTHCSGFETMMAFAREMPNEFLLNTAGTRYTIAA